MSAFLRKYATATTINFPLIGVGTVNFTSTASLTTADLKISKNEGAFATVGTAIVNVGSFGYSYTCTTGDLTAARVMMVIISTASPKACEDSMLLIETYGHTNAQHTFDLSIANQTVIASAGTVTLTAGQVVTVGTNNDKTGYSLTQAFPANFSALSITAVTGLVSISTGATVVAGTVSDKSGYSLTQVFPTNFADLSITATTGAVKVASGTVTAVTNSVNIIAGQVVTVGTNNDKTGYSLSQAFPTNFADLSITATTGLVSISTGATVNVGTVATAVVTSIWSQAASELTGVPGITASILSALSWMFTLSKNKITQTSTLQTVYKTDGSTTVATSTIADDGTTFTKGSWN